MEIGIQRKSWICLKVCDWGISICKVTCFLTAPLLALMIMIAPAHAAVESKAPLTGGDTWKSTWWHLHNQVYPSADATCAADIPPWWTEPGSSYTYLGITPVINPKASNLPEGTLNCNFRVFSNMYTAYPTSMDTVFGGAYPWPYPTCPVPTVSQTVPYVYNASKNICERTVPDPVQCPANSSGTPPACTCNAGYKLDAAGTSCVPVAPPVTCPIPKFPEPPYENDIDPKCTASLEEGAGKDVHGVCKALDPEIVKQEQCLAKKIRALGISYTEPSATVRTVTYQKHFVDLWEWHKVKIPEAQKRWSDAEKQECAPMVAKIESEWKKHKLKGEPSKSEDQAPHVLRKAVDIDEAVVDAMKKKVNNTTFVTPPYCLFCMPPIPVYIGDVQDYVNSPLINPPPCKLRWGGRFKKKNGQPNPDPVHFDLFLK